MARACVLAREILAVTSHYNTRAKTTGLPPLELGIGVAFQDSAPALWMDGDSRIMISKALNLSDRLSSCSNMAKRLFQSNVSPFNLFQLQALMDEAAGDEMEVPLIRYNLNAIELNEEGFEKLSSEIALAPMAGNFPMPWGKERVQLYFGEVPLAGVARTDHRPEGFHPAIAARGENRRRGEQGLLRSLHGCAVGGGCAEKVSGCFREELNDLREQSKPFLGSGSPSCDAGVMLCGDASKIPSAAEAALDCPAITARLKPCPDAKRLCHTGSEARKLRPAIHERFPSVVPNAAKSKMQIPHCVRDDK